MSKWMELHSWIIQVYRDSFNKRQCFHFISLFLNTLLPLPTSSTSTRDTSGCSSAPSFFFLFLGFPPPCSSLTTASRNFFWLCDFWDLKTEKISVCLGTFCGIGVWLGCPLCFITNLHTYFHTISSCARLCCRWWVAVSSHWGSSRCVWVSLHGIWVPFLVVFYHFIDCYTSHCCTHSHCEPLVSSAFSSQLISLSSGQCLPFFTPQAGPRTQSCWIKNVWQLQIQSLLDPILSYL